ncbi:MAG: DNA-3-methyladenine glycosylase [Chloroflexi bacterium]|nr:DNA-3-methyladenine glycosylase [Chloroflexota bacterium]
MTKQARFVDYEKEPVTVAKRLLGQRLVHIVNGKRLAGTIIEVEAYLGAKDEACHTFGGSRTKRNQSMYLEAGHSYVYFTYGMHYCMNVVCGRPGIDKGMAVLIRAIEPTQGIEQMFSNRKAARNEIQLCSGPAKLAQAFEIDCSLDGVDMRKSKNLFIELIRPKFAPDSEVEQTARVGVAHARLWANKQLRYFLRGYEGVSKWK